MLMGQRGRDTLDRVARRQGPCADIGPADGRETPHAAAGRWPGRKFDGGFGAGALTSEEWC